MNARKFWNDRVAVRGIEPCRELSTSFAALLTAITTFAKPNTAARPILSLMLKRLSCAWSMTALSHVCCAQGVPTRKRISRRERSTVWAMLRDPAYKGTACFNKTKLPHGNASQDLFACVEELHPAIAPTMSDRGTNGSRCRQLSRKKPSRSPRIDCKPTKIMPLVVRLPPASCKA
jgi:hypothetical protein